MNLIKSIVLNKAIDPSQTTMLREAFVRAMRMRFNKLRKLIYEVIVDDDVFGMSDNVTGFSAMERDNQQRENRSKGIYINKKPGPGAFRFTRSGDKVAAFMKWLQEQVQDDILQVTQIAQVGSAVDAAWTNIYIQDSYKRGIMRARTQLKGVAPPIGLTGGVEASLMNPFHIDRLGLLFTRVFNELKGITDAMDQQISRVLSQAMADGVGPRAIARRLNQVITGMGKDLSMTDSLGRFIPAQRRAETLARTEIIRAHAEAQLQEFENWGVAGVTAKAEFVTAGDGRVCEKCASLAGQIRTIKQAHGIIPVHPGCRCIWIPYIEN